MDNDDGQSVATRKHCLHATPRPLSWPATFAPLFGRSPDLKRDRSRTRSDLCCSNKTP